MWGRRPALLVGLVGFAGASVLGGDAHSFSTLVTARALQGVFAALVAPAALAVDERRASRTRASGPGPSPLRRGDRLGGGGRPDPGRGADPVGDVAVVPRLQRGGLPGASWACSPGSTRRARRAGPTWTRGHVSRRAASSSSSTGSAARSTTAGPTSRPGGAWPGASPCSAPSSAGSAARPRRWCRCACCSSAPAAAALLALFVTSLGVLLPLPLPRLLPPEHARITRRCAPGCTSCPWWSRWRCRRRWPARGSWPGRPAPMVPVGMLLGMLGMALFSKLTPGPDYVGAVLPGLVLTGLRARADHRPRDGRATPGSPARRRRGGGAGQHHPGGRRVGGHRAAQHHRGDRVPAVTCRPPGGRDERLTGGHPPRVRRRVLVGRGFFGVGRWPRLAARVRRAGARGRPRPRPSRPRPRGRGRSRRSP